VAMIGPQSSSAQHRQPVAFGPGGSGCESHDPSMAGWLESQLR
jgi:hypothetical protein